MNKKSLCIQLICLVIVLFFASTTCTQDTQPQKQLLKQGNDSYYQKGILYIGFKKGVTQARAEEILKNLNFKYKRTENINAVRRFFYETGEKFLIRVPNDKELVWVEKLNRRIRGTPYLIRVKNLSKYLTG